MELKIMSTVQWPHFHLSLQFAPQSSIKLKQQIYYRAEGLTFVESAHYQMPINDKPLKSVNYRVLASVAQHTGTLSNNVAYKTFRLANCTPHKNNYCTN